MTKPYVWNVAVTDMEGEELRAGDNVIYARGGVGKMGATLHRSTIVSVTASLLRTRDGDFAVVDGRTAVIKAKPTPSPDEMSNMWWVSFNVSGMVDSYGTTVSTMVIGATADGALCNAMQEYVKTLAQDGYNFVYAEEDGERWYKDHGREENLIQTTSMARRLTLIEFSDMVHEGHMGQVYVDRL